MSERATAEDLSALAAMLDMVKEDYVGRQEAEELGSSIDRLGQELESLRGELLQGENDNVRFFTS